MRTCSGGVAALLIVPRVRIVGRALVVVIMAVTSFLVADARAGDVDDASFFARLDLLPGAPGGSSGLDLRATAPSAPGVLLLGAAVNAVDPDGGGPLPFVRVLGAGTIVAPIALDPSGRLRVLVPVPAVPALASAHVFAQALLALPSGAIEASNVAATTIAPAFGPSFADRSWSLPPSAQSEFAGQATAGDLDQDGDPDLIVATTTGIRAYRNDGAFVFTDVSATALPSATDDVFVVQVFDADGDGDLDLFAGGGPGDAQGPPLHNRLFNNVSAAGVIAFVPAPSFPDTPGLPQDVVVVDLDGDGDLDIVLANGGDPVHGQEPAGSNVLLVNQGFAQNGIHGDFAVDAAFANAVWNAPSNFNLGVAAGDVDGDGDPDLFFARSDTSAIDGVPGQPNLLLRNDGGLAFSDVSASSLHPAYSDNARGARLADLDGDGDLDLVVAASVTSIKSALTGEYYRNDGTGSFTEDAAAFPQIDESELSIRLGVHVDDVDLDGDLDVFMAVHEFIDIDGSTGANTGGDDLLFLNQGGAQGGAMGTFAVDTTYTSFAVFITADAVFADFDLDGDDDVFLPSGGAFFGGTVPHALIENTRIP